MVHETGSIYPSKYKGAPKCYIRQEIFRDQSDQEQGSYGKAFAAWLKQG